MKRKTILINAYACNPYMGSEEGVGWGWVMMIHRMHDVHVIVASYHKEDIEKYLQAHPESTQGMYFHYVPHKPWHYRPTKGWKYIEGSMLKPIMNFAYRLWLIDAYRLAKRLHKAYDFDLAHQLTYVGFRFPGYLWKLDIPFVWGPLGGLENTPWRFLPAMGYKGMIYYAGRNVVNTLHKTLLITPKIAFKKAQGGVIAATESIAKEIETWYGLKSEIICEIGPPQGRAHDFTRREEGEVFKLAWSGEHLPGKALPLLLQALSTLPRSIAWQLDILGTGPLTAVWQAQAEEFGIAKQCRWHGKIPRDEAVALVHGAHLFVITSMKDLTSTVLLEALSQGVPVVAPDHCGFANVITPECGIKVGLGSIESFIAGLRDAIVSLEADETARRTLASGALKRIEDYSWEAKAEQLQAIYARKLHTKEGAEK